MLTVGWIAFAGASKLAEAMLTNWYEEQLFRLAVAAAQAAVTVWGSKVILLPTFNNEFGPG